MVIFFVILLFMIIAGIIAVETRDLLSAVVSVGAVGFGGSLMFLFLRAPDIALTQIVVEVLSLIILIRAVISRDRTFVTGGREFFTVSVATVILLAIFVAGIEVFRALPPFGTAAFTTVADSASWTYLEDGLRNTGATNLVSAVYLDYRAYDTLGEATVLFTAILGALVILRRKRRKRVQEADA